MSFFSPPSPPDPVATSNKQNEYNINTGSSQQRLNMVDQINPYGALQYTQTGVNADGTPKFQATSDLSPDQQNLLRLRTSGQASLGEAGRSLASDVQGMYSQAPQINPSELTNKMMGWWEDYMSPIHQKQQNALDAKLHNQGIDPGNKAWDSAQNLQARNVNDARTSMFLQAEPQAFSQAMSEYRLPLDTLGMLGGMASPTNPSFMNTPTVNVQPPNYMGAVQQNYQAENQNYQNLMKGMFGMGTALIGGPARMISGGWGSGGGVDPMSG